MKKLGKLKLNQLSKAEMERRELTNLMGGDIPPVCCAPCGCEYAGQQCETGGSMWGGSSIQDNRYANNTQAQD